MLAINNEDNLDIYIEEEKEEIDELTRYLGERRANRAVSIYSYYYYIFILHILTI